MAPPTSPPVPGTSQRMLRVILLAGLAATVAVLGINAYDSGIFKGPLFVTTAILLVGTVCVAGAGKRTILLTRSPGDLPVAGLAALSIAGLFLAPVPPLARQAVMHMVACGVFFFAGTHLFGARAQHRTLLLFMAWLAAATALFGLVQYFFAEQLSLEFYLGADRRIGSLLGSPAFYGGFIVLVTPLLLSAAIGSALPRSTRRLLGAVVAMVLLSLFLTRSRSSIIAAVISLGLLAVLQTDGPRRRLVIRTSLLLAVGGALLLGLLPAAQSWMVHALDAGPGSTLARRWFFWEAGVRAFLHSPVWGYGAGSFEPVMIRFRSPGYWIAKSEDVVPHAHNEIVETAVELGILGLCLTVWLFVAVLRPALRHAAAPGGWRRPVATGLLCGLIGLAIDNLTNVSLRQAPVAAVAWLFAGILAGMPPTAEAAPRPLLARNVPRWILICVAALCLCFLVWYIPHQADAAAADRHIITGLLQIGRGEDKRAVNELRQAIALDPGTYLARSSLAGELLKVGRPGDAVKEAEALLALYPDYPRSWLIVAVGLLGTNRVEEAREAIRKDIAFRDHPEEFYVQSVICRTAADTAAERTALRKVLERCLAGGIPMHAVYATARLREIGVGQMQAGAVRDLLDTLHSAFPGEQALQAQLHALDSLLARTPPAASSLP